MSRSDGYRKVIENDIFEMRRKATELLRRANHLQDYLSALDILEEKEKEHESKQKIEREDIRSSPDTATSKGEEKEN